MNTPNGQAIIKPGRKWHYATYDTGTIHRWSLCGRAQSGNDGWKIAPLPTDTIRLCGHCRIEREKRDALALPSATAAGLDGVEPAARQVPTDTRNEAHCIDALYTVKEFLASRNITMDDALRLKVSALVADVIADQETKHAAAEQRGRVAGLTAARNAMCDECRLGDTPRKDRRRGVYEHGVGGTYWDCRATNIHALIAEEARRGE